VKRNPTLPPNFMLGYAIAAPNLQNYGFQGRRGLDNKIHSRPLAASINNKELHPDALAIH
jgi:hypothetical protein